MPEILIFPTALLFLFFSAVASCAQPPATPAATLEFFVSTTGNDAWTGRLSEPNASVTDGPFATLERARDTIRELKKTPRTDRGIIIYIRAGTYLRDHTFELSAADAAPRERPTVYRAYGNETVRLLGGKPVQSFDPVTDPAILRRLDPAAQKHVLRSDLKAQGITDYGAIATRGYHRITRPAGLELFYRNSPMRLARWPKEGFALIAAVPKGPDGGSFICGTDRVARWANEPDLWVHGYWTKNWADSYEKVRAIDVARKEIFTEPPHGVYGYSPQHRFCLINSLSELDQPGEWYLDRDAGVLYFWPPDAVGEGDAVVSTLTAPMLTMTDVSNVTIRGFRFECSRGAGAIVIGGSSNLIAGCAFTNLGTFGVSFGDHYEDLTDALNADSTLNRHAGTHNGILSCDIAHTGEGGIFLGGGDRRTLEPGENFAVNNRITDFARWVRTYRAAIEVDGVGNRVAHNVITDGPHVGILLKGNDHLIEYNEVARVCTETIDAGGFYMGRDFSERGNVIRYNLFHDIGIGSPPNDINGIYLDDCSSGTRVYSNVLYRTGRGVKVGGGRDNSITNNLFIDCDPAVHIDARGLNWMKGYFDGSNTLLFDRLHAVRGAQPPYSRHYPELAQLLSDESAVPKGNRVTQNIRVGGSWSSIEDLVPDLAEHDNFITGDPMIVSPQQLDFHLRPGSPVWQIGFKPIPLDMIGIQEDEYRAVKSVGRQ